MTRKTEDTTYRERRNTVELFVDHAYSILTTDVLQRQRYQWLKFQTTLSREFFQTYNCLLF